MVGREGLHRGRVRLPVLIPHDDAGGRKVNQGGLVRKIACSVRRRPGEPPREHLPGVFMGQRLFIGGGPLFIRQAHPGAPFLVFGQAVGVVLVDQALGPLLVGEPFGKGARVLPADVYHRVVFPLGEAGPGRSLPARGFQELLEVLHAHLMGHDQGVSPYRGHLHAQAVGPGRAEDDGLVRLQLEGKV